jgi:hypothetical protein
VPPGLAGRKQGKLFLNNKVIFAYYVHVVLDGNCTWAGTAYFARVYRIQGKIYSKNK